jgi:hypothetical protein
MWSLLREIQKNEKHPHSRVGAPQFLWWSVRFTLSLLFLSASMTAPTCKATIISLEPFALNADFQHFIPTSTKFHYFTDTPERKVWGERRPKDRVNLQIILVFTLTHLKTFTQGRVSVCDKYLHWPRVSVKIYIYTLQQDKCKCKKVGCVSVNLHLHWIYTSYILTLTHTTLV